MPQLIILALLTLFGPMTFADVPSGCAKCMAECPHASREYRECDRGCPTSCSRAQAEEYRQSKKDNQSVANPESSTARDAQCLLPEDKKELEELERDYALAVKQSPNCKTMRGAAGCLDPFSLMTLNILREKQELQKLNAALKAAKIDNPDCVGKRGAAACLMPADVKIRNELLAKYPECNDGQKSIELDMPTISK